MTSSRLGAMRLALLVTWCFAGAATAEPLTADQAVQVALRKNSRAVNAEADVLSARGGVYNAYSGILPHLSAGWARNGSWIDNSAGRQVFGNVVTPQSTFDQEAYSTVPQLTGTWSVLNLSSLKNWSDARQSLKSAQLAGTSARNDIALDVRRQFYLVVNAIHTARVNTEALKLSRDDERRVRALFDVGSVSKSDVLRAQVRTSQSELDSLTATHDITVQRVNLATLMGIPEVELGDVDTTLVVTTTAYDEAQLQAEAVKNRPDIQSAQAELGAAKAGRWSARLLRFPYVTVSGSAQYNTKNSATTKEKEPPPPVETTSSSKTDAAYRASVALNWDFFDGLATDGANALAQARLMRAEEVLSNLQRNLAAEVHEALLNYTDATQGLDVASRTVESATENVKLTQEKYNVGSATILDLIDAQVQLQRAQTQEVTARAAVRVAEAQIRRATGRLD